MKKLYVWMLLLGLGLCLIWTIFALVRTTRDLQNQIAWAELGRFTITAVPTAVQFETYKDSPALLIKLDRTISLRYKLGKEDFSVTTDTLTVLVTEVHANSVLFVDRSFLSRLVTAMRDARPITISGQLTGRRFMPGSDQPVIFVEVWDQ